MKLIRLFAAFVACFIGYSQAFGAATILPPPRTCFSATTGVTGMVAVLGTVVPGAGGVAGTYVNVPLSGGTGTTSATANIIVAGGGVTSVVILNPGVGYTIGDNLSAAASSIGGTAGFSVPVNSTAINSALAGGKVTTYVPNTSVFKSTWFDADQASSHQNSNPILLDSNGCATILGTGSYRFLVQDSLGNTVYDQVTADTSSSSNVFWAGQAGGTPNAITVTDAGFNNTSGSIIYFTSLNANTGSVTLTPSGTGVPILITKSTSTGPTTLASGDIPPNTNIGVIYNAVTNTFQLITPQPNVSAGVASIDTPQGYLTLSSDLNNVVVTADTTGQTIYYTPFAGNIIPIFGGSSFANITFQQLPLVLTSSFGANTIYDACVFLNNGLPVLVGGPAWSNSSAGTGARGSGAGSAQIQKLTGIYVNAVQITGVNGANTYTIPAQQCTYVGSFFVDSVAGQVTVNTSFGQSRKWGIWNAYQQQPIRLQAGDGTASWIYNTAAIRPSNNNSANSLTTFTGLAETPAELSFQQKLTDTSAFQAVGIVIGVGYNSTTVFSGTQGVLNTNTNATTTPISSYLPAPSLGINTVNSLEEGSGAANCTFFGTQSNMILVAKWRG